VEKHLLKWAQNRSTAAVDLVVARRLTGLLNVNSLVRRIRCSEDTPYEATIRRFGFWCLSVL